MKLRTTLILTLACCVLLSASANAAFRLPAPQLPAVRGWHVTSTGSNPSPPSAAVTMAATISLRHDRDGANALPPSWALNHLPPTGIIIQALNYGRQRLRNYPAQALPLTIRGVPVARGFEGVPRRFAFVRVPARIRGWTVEVYVWFGMAKPTPALVAKADREVRKLVFPS